MLKVAVLAGHGLVCLPIYLVGDLLQSGRLLTVLDDYTRPPGMIPPRRASRRLSLNVVGCWKSGSQWTRR